MSEHSLVGPPCWIIHQPDGEGVIANNDNKDLMFRTRLECEHFFVSRMLFNQGFAGQLIVDSNDWINAAEADGRGATWYEPDEQARLELGMVEV